MNVKIETETKYFNIIAGIVLDEWYTLECATDYRNEFGGEVKAVEFYREVPQPCEMRINYPPHKPRR